jgi:hypothetical protein
MVTISHDQLYQVEYLFDQSLKGNHVLFDRDWLDDLVTTGADSLEIRAHQMEKVQDLFETFLTAPTLAKKREYLENLSRDDRRLLMASYLNIVESNMSQDEEDFH